MREPRRPDSRRDRRQQSDCSSCILLGCRGAGPWDKYCLSLLLTQGERHHGMMEWHPMHLGSASQLAGIEPSLLIWNALMMPVTPWINAQIPANTSRVKA